MGGRLRCFVDDGQPDRLLISLTSARSLSMAIASMTIELKIPHARSLKDRRQVVRSLKEKLAHGFNVSIAEMDEAVTWQSATIGAVAISASRDYLTGQMKQLEDATVRICNDLGAEIQDAWWEFLD